MSGWGEIESAGYFLNDCDSRCFRNFSNRRNRRRKCRPKGAVQNGAPIHKSTVRSAPLKASPAPPDALAGSDGELGASIEARIGFIAIIIM